MPDSTVAAPIRSGDYHGIFAKLHDLNIADRDVALYDAGLADFYNNFLGDFVADIPHFENLLATPAMEVLDLACGAGRIGIALARKGLRVDGLELSEAMLTLAQTNQRGEPLEVRERMTFVQGDMADFDLGKRYDLIILGVTSISLLLSEQHRLGLFRSVRRHLADGGRFIFDILDLEDGKWKDLDYFHDVWSKETDEGVDFGIVGQKFYPETRQFIFNVYREIIGWDGDTRRVIGHSVKAWLERSQMVSEMKVAGLEIEREFQTGRQIYFVVRTKEDQA